MSFDNDSSMVNLSLRFADSGDEIFLQELFYDVRSIEFVQMGFPEDQLKPLLAMQYNAQKQSYSAQFPDSVNSIIEFAGERIGRLLVDRKNDQIFLVDIAILHNFRNRGFGNYLIDGLKRESESIGLSVYKSNFGAIKLYKKHGFLVTNDDGMYLEMEWKNVG
jgi:ribosomal protein S18 acetylase RimI-like enzyme